MTEAVTHIGEGGVVADGPHTGAHLTGQGVATLITVHPDDIPHSCHNVTMFTDNMSTFKMLIRAKLDRDQLIQ